MKYFRVSLVGVKSLFFCSEIETKINTSSVIESDKDEIGVAFFFKLIFTLRFNQFLLVIIHK